MKPSLRAFLFCLAIFSPASFSKSSVLSDLNERDHISHHLSFKHISKLFVGCHLKFIFLTYKGKSSFVKRTWQAFDEIASALEDRVTISLFHVSSHFGHPFRGTSRLNVTSHNICTVFTCVYSEKDFKTRNKFHDHYYYILSKLVKYKVWPSHYVFLGKLLSYSNQAASLEQRSIHPIKLSLCPIRGVVIFINHLTSITNLICFPCHNEPSLIFRQVNLATISSLENLRTIVHHMNSRLRGGFVVASQSNRLIPEILCTMRGNLRDSYTKSDVMIVPPQDHCAHHILKHKFNYTVTTKFLVHVILHVAREMSLTNHNYKVMSNDGLQEWSEFLAQFSPLTYSAYQKRPIITAAVLIRPLSWEVWLVILFVLTVLGILTFAVEKIQNFDLRLVPIPMELLASVLCQDMHRNAQIIINKKPHNLLHAWLLVWMVMMVVLSSAYLGIIFSYIANGIPPEWILSLKEALKAPTYLKITVSSYTEASDPTIPLSQVFRVVDRSSIDDLNMGPGQLQKIIRYHDPRIFMRSMLNRSSFLKHENFMETDHSRLAIVDFHDTSNKYYLFLKSMYSNEIVSFGPNVVPSVQLLDFWAQKRTFFSEMFAWGLGQLDQSGFLDFMQNRIIVGARCNYLFSWLTSLDYKLSFRDEVLRKCRYLANTRVDASLMNNYPMALSWRQLHAIFYIFLQAFVLPLFVFLVEIIWFKQLLKTWSFKSQLQCGACCCRKKFSWHCQPRKWKEALSAAVKFVKAKGYE